MSTTALTKVTSSALGKLQPHAVRWFLKKYYPLDTRKFVIEFNRFPNVSLNFDSQEHTLWFDFRLNNFSLYEVELLQLEYDISVRGHVVIRIKESIIHQLKADSSYHFQSSHLIAPGEASRIKQYATESETNVAEISFYFTARSRFGIEDIRLPEKLACIHVRQYPNT